MDHIYRTDHPAFADPLALMDMSSIGMGKGWEATGAMRRLPIAIDQLSSLGDNDEPSPFYRSGRFYGLDDEGQQTMKSDDGLLSACPFDPAHRFFFCSDMRPDEAWLFKQWDTREGPDARVCFHSAVHDPFYDGGGQRMPTRRSLECRLVLTFPKPRGAKL